MSANAGDYNAGNHNYYELLGVSQSATPQEIKQAYRTLARQYHPDVRSGDDDTHADEMLKRINAAYEVLSDPLKRARYDRAERQRWGPPNPYAVYGTGRTTGSYPAQTPSKAPFKLLFFAIGFVLVMSIIMTVIVLEFTPPPKAPKTVERFYGEQTETITARRIAAINRMPTSTPAPEFLQRAWSPFQAGLTPQYALLPLECTLDLVENEHDCAEIMPIQFLEIPADGQVVVNITLDPRLYGYTRLQFEVQYASDGPIEGWTVHVSDSYSDNRQNNAQVVVTHDNLLIFGQEAASDNTLAPLLVENAVQEGDTLLLEIMNQRVAWSVGGAGQEVISQYLFALGIAQSNENSDYDIYASFNRAVQLDGSPAKIGQGVERVTIRLLSPMILTPTPSPQ